MKMAEPATVAASTTTRTSKYSKVYEEFLAIPADTWTDPGAWAEFSPGTDFDSDPKRFGQALRAAVRSRAGLLVAIRSTPDGAVLARIDGKIGDTVPNRRGRKPATTTTAADTDAAGAAGAVDPGPAAEPAATGPVFRAAPVGVSA